jgi:hypothetical protein
VITRCISRAVLSLVPPGALGAISVTERVGFHVSCAAADATASAKSIAYARRSATSIGIGTNPLRNADSCMIRDDV